MDTEAANPTEEIKETPAAVVVVTTATTTDETGAVTTDKPETVAETTTTVTTTTEKVVENGETTAPVVTTTTTTTTVTNGAPRSFQFGAKAKMFRDMLAQHKPQLDSDQTQILFIIGLLTLACLCSLGAIGTNYWQCEGDLHVGLWNTCQEQTIFTAPETTNSTETNSTTVTTTVMCVYHNSRNNLDLIVADQTRIDQVHASQGLIVCGTILYVASLFAMIFVYRFIKNKPSRNMNMMRNLLVAGIFAQLLAFLLQLVGFFFYILTERHSTSVGLLFVYFGLAMFGTNVINFITIEYKAYKQRQQQIQIN